MTDDHKHFEERPAHVPPLAEAPPLEVQRAQEERLEEVWKSPPGWRYWSDVNNTSVGLWYLIATCGFFLFGGVLALIMRVQLAVPNNDFVSANTYHQVFTLHGSIMMFLFAVPILEAFSVYILPAMTGARDLPFPRLSAYGFWCFLFGGVFVCISIFFNMAPRGGWFMYPPLTTAYQKDVGADIWLLGLTFIEISSLALAVELIVGVLKCRPPGMRVNLMPLYAWYILVVAVMIVFAFPPLIAGDVLLEMERAFDWPFFDASRGGDPLLWQHLFWIFGHPEVYIVFLPSVALVAMIVPTFARRPLIGYGWIVLAAVGTGFLSFGLWVHHMFTTGLPGITLSLFSAASQAVAVPTGVQIFCFLATVMAGRTAWSAAMMFIVGGLATFIIGGLTGVMIALVPFDFQAHDSYFIVSHLHYVLVGGTIFPIVGGIYYYYPVVRSKQLSERLGKLAFWLMLVGFNITFFPMHFTGLWGMPRRVYTYAAGRGFEELNLLATIGAFILAAGFAVVLWDVLRPKGKQPLVKRNLWGAGTLDWAGRVPTMNWGIRSVPEIDGRYPLWEQENLLRDIDEGRYFLPDAEEGLRETLVTSVIDARPEQCLRIAGPSFMPLIAAAFTAGFFILATFYYWYLAIASGVLAVALLVGWIWRGTGAIPEKREKYIGLGVTLPLYRSGPASVSWWGMFITMLGDFTAFMSLVFGYFFYWTGRDDFPPDPLTGPGTFWPLVGGGLLMGAWLAAVVAHFANHRDRSAGVYVALFVAIVLSILGSLALFAGPWTTGLDPTEHVYPATVWVLVGWTILHTLLGALMLAFCAARRAAGKLTHEYSADIVNVLLYWHFLGLTALITVGVLAGFPLVA